MKSVILILSALLCAARHPAITRVVVLMEENRSFDHLYGLRSGVDGVTTTTFNHINGVNGGQVNVTQDAPNVAPCDPDHSFPGTTEKIFGPQAVASGTLSNPTMGGFVATEAGIGGAHGTSSNYCRVMDCFNQSRLPVFTALADEFVLMDRFFASVPGPTWPNRLFHLTGTSCGLTETSNPWFNQTTGRLFPLRTIFDQVQDAGFTWKNYVNDTPWELFISTIATNVHRVVPMDEFYSDAAAGTLPHFSLINPRAGINVTTGAGSNDMHPDHDVALGEQYVKDIYEALRASH
jgi:phospholipase C